MMFDLLGGSFSSPKENCAAAPPLPAGSLLSHFYSQLARISLTAGVIVRH